MRRSVVVILISAVLACGALSACSMEWDGSGDGSAGGFGHTHTFAEVWSRDEVSHWHEATCGHEEVSEKASHAFKNGQCKVCGYEIDAATDVSKIPTETVAETEWNVALSESAFENFTMKGGVLVPGKAVGDSNSSLTVKCGKRSYSYIAEANWKGEQMILNGSSIFIDDGGVGLDYYLYLPFKDVVAIPCNRGGICKGKRIEREFSHKFLWKIRRSELRCGGRIL